jgi:hypothetical protein
MAVVYCGPGGNLPHVAVRASTGGGGVVTWGGFALGSEQHVNIAIYLVVFAERAGR